MEFHIWFMSSCLLIVVNILTVSAVLSCPSINTNTQDRQNLEDVKSIVSAEECFKKCHEKPACKFWSWHHKDSGIFAFLCVLMSGYGYTVFDTNVISGSRDCNPGGSQSLCPPQKTVGGVCYERIDDGVDTSSFGCTANCTYKKVHSSETDGEKFCFKPGNLLVGGFQCGNADLDLVLTGGKISSSAFTDSSEVITYTGTCKPDIPLLPTKLSRGQTIWIKDTLILCGGLQTGLNSTDHTIPYLGQSTNSCWSFQPGDKAWSDTRLCGPNGCVGGRRNNMMEARFYLTLTVINTNPGEVVAAGGKSLSNKPLDSIEVYSFAKHTWKRQSTKLPNARHGHCAVLYYIGAKPYLIIIGGALQSYWSPPTASVIKIDLKTWDISPMKDLPEGLYRPGCVTQNGFIYVSGGSPLSGLQATKVYRYSFDTNDWSVQGNLKTRRQGHIMGITAKNQMVVAGGWNGRYLKSIEDSDNSGQKWSLRSQGLQEGREYAAMAEVPAHTFNCAVN